MKICYFVILIFEILLNVNVFYFCLDLNGFYKIVGLKLIYIIILRKFRKICFKELCYNVIVVGFLGVL